MYFKMFTTIRLVNTALTSQNYHFVVVVMVRTLKLHCRGNFQVYNTVWLTIVTMLYICSPELIHLILGSLQPLTNISPCPAPLSPWQPPLDPVSTSSTFLVLCVPHWLGASSLPYPSLCFLCPAQSPPQVLSKYLR